jgi:hypothetical protein
MTGPVIVLAWACMVCPTNPLTRTVRISSRPAAGQTRQGTYKAASLVSSQVCLPP